jgi:hypothetical protein
VISDELKTLLERNIQEFEINRGMLQTQSFKSSEQHKSFSKGTGKLYEHLKCVDDFDSEDDQS